MDNSQIAKASLNDIVFEGRNKAYGAYVLRRLYQRHVTRALIIATAVFLLLIAFPLISQFLKENRRGNNQSPRNVPLVQATQHVGSICLVAALKNDVV